MRRNQPCDVALLVVAGVVGEVELDMDEYLLISSSMAAGACDERCDEVEGV